MSSPIDKIRIGEKYDGRRRITDDQREEIKNLYSIGKSIHSIANSTGVSRRSVQLILFPERYEAIKARAKEVKRWEAYNTADIRREVMRKHRAKKRDLVNRGVLIISK